MMYKGLKANESTLSNRNPGRPILIVPQSTSWISFSATGVWGTATGVNIMQASAQFGPYHKVAEILAAGARLNIELGQGWYAFVVAGGDGSTLLDVAFNV